MNEENPLTIVRNVLEILVLGVAPWAFGWWELIKLFTAASVLALAFNWLAPLDEYCVGHISFDSAQPTYECYKIDQGIEPWDVRAA